MAKIKNLDIVQRTAMNKNISFVKNRRDVMNLAKWVGRGMATAGAAIGIGLPGAGTILGGTMLFGTGVALASGSALGERKNSARLGTLQRGAARKRAAVKALSKKQAISRIGRAKQAKKSDGVRDAYTNKHGTFVAAKPLTAKQRRPRRSKR